MGFTQNSAKQSMAHSQLEVGSSFAERASSEPETADNSFIPEFFFPQQVQPETAADANDVEQSAELTSQSLNLAEQAAVMGGSARTASESVQLGQGPTTFFDSSAQAAQEQTQSEAAAEAQSTEKPEQSFFDAFQNSAAPEVASSERSSADAYEELRIQKLEETRQQVLAQLHEVKAVPAGMAQTLSVHTNKGQFTSKTLEQVLRKTIAFFTQRKAAASSYAEVFQGRQAKRAQQGGMEQGSGRADTMATMEVTKAQTENPAEFAIDE